MNGFVRKIKYTFITHEQKQGSELKYKHLSLHRDKQANAA